MESLLAVSLATYAGTALDNLLMLTVLRAAGADTRVIASGFLIGSAVVLAICAAGTGLAVLLPPHLIGYLGVVPIALGVTGLLTAFRHRGAEPATQRRSDAGGIAALQIASSFDSIAAFLPLFADTERPYGLVIAAGFAAMTLLWLLVARALAGIPGMATALRPIERYARPLILILVGLYVLSNTSLDLEPGPEAAVAAPTLAMNHEGRIKATDRPWLDRLFLEAAPPRRGRAKCSEKRDKPGSHSASRCSPQAARPPAPLRSRWISTAGPRLG